MISTCSRATAPGWSLRTLLHEGLNGVPGKVEAGPPKHMSSAVGQIVNFLGTLQNEWAGAQAFSSFDTYMAPFIRKDGMSYEQVRQCIEELIYNLNVPSRWGTQTPFTNLTFDWTCPEDLREQIPVIAGEEMPFSYGEPQVEMDMVNRAYIEVMTTGDAKGRVFTFPIPTYNMTPDFPWSRKTPMCCRLQLDLRELLKRGNGLFGSAEQTGSVGVVTVNCARLGYEYRGDEAGLLRRLDALLGLARNGLEIKRKEIQRLMDNGLFPYTKRYLGTLRNHFSTIGVNGVNEMIRNFTGDEHDITTEWGHDFAVRLLDHIRGRIAAFQEETGHMYNLEATPAEGTTYRFAKEDAKRYPDILPAGAGARAVLHQLDAAPGRATPTMPSRRWSGRTTCSASTPVAPCCTSTCPSTSRRRTPAGSWCGARLSAFACPTSPSRPRFPSAPNTATSQASTSSFLRAANTKSPGRRCWRSCAAVRDCSTAWCFPVASRRCRRAWQTRCAKCVRSDSGSVCIPAACIPIDWQRCCRWSTGWGWT